MGRNGKMRSSKPAKTISGDKSRCSKGIQTMEIRYDSHGNMTDSCGNSIGGISSGPYNPNKPGKAVPLSKRRKRGK